MTGDDNNIHFHSAESLLLATPIFGSLLNFYVVFIFGISTFVLLQLGLLNEVRICELQILSLNSYSFFSPSIFESKHH